jgi:hypothetical protein
MSTLEELKEQWGKKSASVSSGAYDESSFQKIVTSRVRKNVNTSMKYFWGSFTLQLIVYALLSHVMVKHWSEADMVLLSVAGIVLYLPFTIVLMRKFRGMAVTKPVNTHRSSLQIYVQQHHDLLAGFYRFKKRYELLLIPLSSAIGVWLVFLLYVPGGVAAYPSGAIVSFGFTLLSCAIALASENKKSFEEPLAALKQVLDEFRD